MSDPIEVVEVQSVTALSKIIACDYDYYKDPTRDKTNDAYTLFIVNDGATNGESPVVDFYYGDNRLSQILITESLPENGVEEKVYIKKPSEGAEGEGEAPTGIYVWLDGQYLCLTDLNNSGYISDDSVSKIAEELYSLVAERYIRPTWKTLP